MTYIARNSCPACRRNCRPHGSDHRASSCECSDSGGDCCHGYCSQQSLENQHTLNNLMIKWNDSVPRGTLLARTKILIGCWREASASHSLLFGPVWPSEEVKPWANPM